MNNGNGKTSPQVIEAQRAAERVARPLQELDNKIAQLQAQLTTTQRDAAALKAEREEWEYALIDEKPGAASKLRDVAQREAENQSRTRALSTKLDASQVQRVEVHEAYQQSQIALAQAVADAEFTYLEEELSKARYHLAQSQEQTVQRQKVVNELADRMRIMATQRRDAEQNAANELSRANFRKLNPEPGFVRTRAGFGL